ncbi:hypothetical protein SLG_04990 [Sphingobium sp. SYK-6]|uniref:hypothetical protein n=1 Tax=Sphingobium sp. (strain NBRC 103272 / SYK-6) TaxID=627192 RepID=UPI00022766C6|nr:hypothetical protein [Sphingobium sp. SYK-6]BAK65174.1 hypothetical protein SLG_04990 [Sphingobium sp. SYK-6]
MASEIARSGRVARHGHGLALGIAALLISGSAQAVTLNGLTRGAFGEIYGSYAPRGECASGPSVTIDDKGFTFRATGRTVTQHRVEYAASFMGPTYDGITSVFFPFPVSANDFGRLIMFVNDDEKRGVIRFDADLGPGQRADPFQAAFTSASPFQLCKGTGAAVTAAPAATRAAPVAPVAGLPMEWTNLPSLVGKYPGSYARDNIDLFDKGAVAAALRSRLGPKMDVLKTNLNVVGPLGRQGNLYYISGNAQHQGGVEQAYVLIDPARKAVQVGLWEKGKLTVYPPAQGGRIPVPAEIATMLQNSPPETATPLPGTPWELVPVQGRAPLAYVSAAGSPNIESLSLYCEGGKPYMAMLLNKPARPGALTMTWNFSGRLVNLPVRAASNNGTQWIGSVSGTPLLPLLMQQKGTVMLRLNGKLEGEASLANAPATLRTALRPCAQL